MKPYNHGQFSVVYKFLSRTPKWLVLGGPASANEAQTAVKKWPKIKVIGVEPLPAAVEWQLAHEWPTANGPLLQAALADKVGEETLIINPTNELAPSLAGWPGARGPEMVVQVMTINQLDETYGPIEDAIIWLDIEGAEYRALRGADRLFDRKQVLLVNVEITASRPQHTVDLETMFANLGFKLVHTWNIQPGLVEDRIYVPA